MGRTCTWQFKTLYEFFIRRYINYPTADFKKSANRQCCVGWAVNGWLRRIEGMCKLFPEKLLKKSMAKQNAVTKARQDNMLEKLREYGKLELCHLIGIGYAGFLEDNRELNITCPSLILVGEKDCTGKVKQYNKAWSQKTGIQLNWIPDAAHNSNVDNPEMVNRCIEKFLVKLTSVKCI